MLTLTGIVLKREEVAQFLERTKLGDFPLASLSWELHRVEVPDLSLREKFILDQEIFNRTAEEVEQRMGFAFREIDRNR